MTNYGNLGTTAIALALIASGVATSACTAPEANSPESAPTSVSIPTLNDVPRRGDAEVMNDIRQHVRAWNDALSPIVADYLDPNVDAEIWVAEAGLMFKILEPKIRAMATLASELADADLQEIVVGIVASYRDKLAMFSALVNAVASGDRGAEQQAQKDLQSANAEAARLVEELNGLGG